MNRHGKTERTIDLLTQEAESRIEGYYTSALAAALRKNRPALRRIQAIMDGDNKPPRYCVTEGQKARWKERQLLRIMKASSLETDLIRAAQKAGESSEKEIEGMRDRIYNVAYEDTYNRLRR